MSRHIWMYEGITDYLAFLLRIQSVELKNNGVNDMSNAIATSLKHKRQSMTKSSKNIIRKRNFVSLVRKFLHIENFYEKGKLIALGIDLELMEKSQGKRRLPHVLLDMKSDYSGIFFQDSLLSETMAKYTYPGFEEYYRKYIEKHEIPPYEKYFEKFGWEYIAKNSKILSYGNFYIQKDETTGLGVVNWQSKKNSLGLLLGDTIISINNHPAIEFLNNSKNYYKIIGRPKKGDILTMQVRRHGAILELKGAPKQRRVRFPMIRSYLEPTNEQIEYRKLYSKMAVREKS